MREKNRNLDTMLPRLCNAKPRSDTRSNSQFQESTSFQVRAHCGSAHRPGHRRPEWICHLGAPPTVVQQLTIASEEFRLPSKKPTTCHLRGQNSRASLDE